MLQLTSAAAAQVVRVRQTQGLPDSVGLRVFGRPRPEGGMAVTLSFTDLPAGDDMVTEQEAVRMFVAPEVAYELSTAAIDVEPGPGGAKLVLTRQVPDEGP